jgi:hypothetical protein
MDAEIATEEKGMANAKEEWKKVITFLQKAENEIQPVFDYSEYCASLELNFDGFRDLHLVDWREHMNHYLGLIAED